MNADSVVIAARWVVPVCASVVLTAVALNFALAVDSGAVKVRKRSPVATASMMGFFFAVYVLIHQHIGLFHVHSSAITVGLAVAGAALVIAGSAVNVLGRMRLGSNWANHVTVYEHQTLVSTGVFGLVRHPLYTSLIWMFIGAALVYHNAAALAATLLVFVPAVRYRASMEERLLSQQFPEYPAYQRRVGMLFPRLWKGRTP
jgi:protein-S-isoprenylcysteine O-methyltransferase Ste14